MGFARTAVGVLFISVLVFYLSTVGQLTDEAKWGFVGAMAVLAFIWINLGKFNTGTSDFNIGTSDPSSIRLEPWE